MAKAEYNSESETEIIIDTKPNEPNEPNEPDEICIPTRKTKTTTKEPRTEKQIEATNKMREKLNARRETNLKIKEQVKIEHDELKIIVKEKIKKNNVKEKVIKSLKKIIDSDSDTEDNLQEQDYPDPSPPPRKQIKKPTQIKPQQQYVSNTYPYSVKFF